MRPLCTLTPIWKFLPVSLRVAWTMRQTWTSNFRKLPCSASGPWGQAAAPARPQRRRYRSSALFARHPTALTGQGCEQSPLCRDPASKPRFMPAARYHHAAAGSWCFPAPPSGRPAPDMNGGQTQITAMRQKARDAPHACVTSRRGPASRPALRSRAPLTRTPPSLRSGLELAAPRH